MKIAHVYSSFLEIKTCFDWKYFHLNTAFCTFFHLFWYAKVYKILLRIGNFLFIFLFEEEWKGRWMFNVVSLKFFSPLNRPFDLPNPSTWGEAERMRACSSNNIGGAFAVVGVCFCCWFVYLVICLFGNVESIDIRSMTPSRVPNTNNNIWFHFFFNRKEHKEVAKVAMTQCVETTTNIKP